ncbi:MAG TPA: type II secretion system F family protein [Solirubrobacteraceae bacterium]
MAGIALVISGTVGVTPTVAKSSAAASNSSAVSPIQGWLGDGAVWPERNLVLFPPHGSTITASTLHVTENRTTVHSLTVTPISQANARDFGLMVVVDSSPSMSGAPLSAAMGAARGLATARSGSQQLGLITSSARPRVFIPLTSNTAALGRAFSSTPPTSPGADLPSAINLGLQQLNKAKVALGAIVVVSDGVGTSTGSGATTSASVKSAAAAANVPVFTVGLQDQAATSATLGKLAAAAPGQFVATTPAHLSSVFGAIYATVTRGSVARWQSLTPPGTPVTVTATVAGAPGQVQATYRSPGTAPPTAAPKHTTPAARPTHRLTAADISLRNSLSPLPSFAATPAAAPGVASTPAPPAARSSSFWNTSSGIFVVAAICGVLLAIALAMALYKPSRRAVRTRVGSFIPGPTDVEFEEVAAPGTPGRTSLLQRLEHGRRWPAFVEDVEISGSAHTPMSLVKRSATLGMILAVIVTAASGSTAFALAPLLLWPVALRKVIARGASKQREKFRDTLPGYLQDLGSAMRVGRSFVGGLTAVVETADQPVRGAFERALSDEAFGRPLEEALEAVATRMQASDLEQVALIAGLNRRSGSNVSEALDRVAEGARERADLRREVKALTGQARMSSWVLTGLPGVLLLAMNIISPLYAKPLFHTTMGIVLLCVGAAMVFGGFKVMKKITDVEP